MRTPATRRGRLGAAVVTTVIVATFATVVPVSAADNGVVTVTGGSASKIVLTLDDYTAEFGNNLTPDAEFGSNSTDGVAAFVDPTTPGSAGACYLWDGLVNVKSNVIYDLTVAAAAANIRLDFHSVVPVDYADCRSGTQVDDDPAMGIWANDEPRGPWATHNYWLGLDVRWADAPNTNLADATLTLTAVGNI